MRSSILSDRSHWVAPALGAALFIAAFTGAFLLTLSGDLLVSPLRQALAKAGYRIAAGESGLRFPLAVKLTDAVVTVPGGAEVPLDTVIAGWDFAGILRGLPGHLRASRNAASIDVLTSPALWNPGRGRIVISNVSSADASTFLPAAAGTEVRISTATVAWTRSAKGGLSGSGTADLATMRIPVPAPDSPVREAVLDNVRMKFTIRGGDLQVSSLTGRYEGSEVEGTGVISRVANPSSGTITFHLRIRNPLEGKVAVLFDLMAKNAKNANLRITGPLLSPAGEFQFF